jgi:hypothetical protein
MKTTTTRIPSGTTGELWHWAEEKRRTAYCTGGTKPSKFTRATAVATPSLRMASGILRRLFQRFGGTRPS